jgi:UDP-N-acetylglucosamine diphosphorylase / glucose-1-phosphate thymidylyltransferase / UDP-N-acetylgalactosamine diphosphorylase / glucosamine-1-phosphate N-acetyltransferase / galactosamine-1-phosphate N-acetyltransferase
MIDINDYIKTQNHGFDFNLKPWQVIASLEKLLIQKISSLASDYHVSGTVAIHKTAKIEEHCVLKGPLIISGNVFIGAHAYLRGGVFLDEHVVIGPGCEVKTCIIHGRTALAHFNFAGDSIIGSGVNMEAGSVIANHYNERTDKTIRIAVDGKIFPIDSQKFGALIGDNCRIGANAVLSPGTILAPGAIVKRLELVEQVPNQN